MTGTCYALVDCNSFYASCEKVFRPDLSARPVVVLSNNDGCIIARSPEAKAIGLKMGEPAFQKEKFLKEHRVAVFSANFVLYGSLSARVMDVLRGMAPDTEIYSIDEAFLDLSGVQEPVRLAAEISNRVPRDTGIPVCVGLGPTKTLAKLANHVAKKLPAFGRVCSLAPGTAAMQTAGSLPVGAIWGIGPQYSAMLKARGVDTVAGFMALPPGWVHRNMTVTGLRTHQELHGTACAGLVPRPPAKQAVCTSRSFGRRLTTAGPVEEAVCTFMANAAAKVRAQGSVAMSVTVFLETDRFNHEAPQYFPSMTAQLAVPTADTLALCAVARQLFRKLFKAGHAYKKAGVLLGGLRPGTGIQLSLWDSPGKGTTLMPTLDRLEKKWGRGSVATASAGTRQPFGMRQAHKSPRYTTCLEELLLVGP